MSYSRNTTRALRGASLEKKMRIAAILLAACGGQLPDDQPDLALSAEVVAVPAQTTGTCTTHAIRSSSGSTTRHSTDGGITWHPGPC